jgi:hypothetical protein
MTVGFGTPTYSGNYGPVALSGVTNGQPIILVIDLGAPADTITDNFTVPYTWTLVKQSSCVAGGSTKYKNVYIGTGGWGTSGTISCSTGYGFLMAFSCTGASGAAGISAISASSSSSGNSTSIASTALTPAAGEGVVFSPLCGEANDFTYFNGFPSSPWAVTNFQFFPSFPYLDGSIALYPNAPASALSPAWTQTYTGTLPPDYAYATVGVSVKVFTATAPSACTLLAPSNASYEDAAAIIPFGATYNSTDGLAANAYALRIKVSGGSYLYWNATSNALQSGIVWNTITVIPTGTITVNLPAGILTDGHVYNWSIAAQESSGSNLQGSFASDSTFTSQTGPVTTISAPTGTISSNVPNITWSSTFASGASQIDYQIVVESGSYGTVPGSGASAWSSGVIPSASTMVPVGVTLTVGVTYRVFVQVTETGPQAGAWAYSTFTPTPDLPASPLLTAVAFNDPTTGLPETKLTVVGQDNLLTANESSLELGTTAGWTAGSNTTATASTTWAQDGNNSLRLAATTSGSVQATTPVGTSAVAVTVGQVIRAMAYFHSPTTGRTCGVTILYYNSAGTYLSYSSSFSVTSTTSGHGAQAFVTATVPAGAAYAAVQLNGSGLSSSEYLYVDSILLAPGTSTTWTIGGLVGLGAVVVTSSDGHLVRGAGWEGNTPLGSNQTVVIYDVEAPPGISYTYSAAITATSSGVVLTGAPGVSNAITNSSENRAWLLDPTIPAGAVGFYMGTNWQPKIHEVGQAYYPLGYGTATKSTDGTKGIQGIIPIFTSSIAEEQAVEALLSTTNVLFFMTPARGGYYVMSDPSQDRMGTAPFEWENTKTPNIQWTFYVLGSQRP